MPCRSYVRLSLAQGKAASAQSWRCANVRREAVRHRRSIGLDYHLEQSFFASERTLERRFYKGASQSSKGLGGQGWSPIPIARTHTSSDASVPTDSSLHELCEPRVSAASFLS